MATASTEHEDEPLQVEFEGRELYLVKVPVRVIDADGMKLIEIAYFGCSMEKCSRK